MLHWFDLLLCLLQTWMYSIPATNRLSGVLVLLFKHMVITDISLSAWQFAIDWRSLTGIYRWWIERYVQFCMKKRRAVHRPSALADIILGIGVLSFTAAVVNVNNSSVFSALSDILYRVPLYRNVPIYMNSLSSSGHGDEVFNNYFPPPPLFPPPPPSWIGDTNAILREAIFISIDSHKAVSVHSIYSCIILYCIIYTVHCE